MKQTTSEKREEKMNEIIKEMNEINNKRRICEDEIIRLEPFLNSPDKKEVQEEIRANILCIKDCFNKLEALETEYNKIEQQEQLHRKLFFGY